MARRPSPSSRSCPRHRWAAAPSSPRRGTRRARTRGFGSRTARWVRGRLRRRAPSAPRARRPSPRPGPPAGVIRAPHPPIPTPPHPTPRRGGRSSGGTRSTCPSTSRRRTPSGRMCAPSATPSAWTSRRTSSASSSGASGARAAQGACAPPARAAAAPAAARALHRRAPTATAAAAALAGSGAWRDCTGCRGSRGAWRAPSCRTAPSPRPLTTCCGSSTSTCGWRRHAPGAGPAAWRPAHPRPGACRSLRAGREQRLRGWRPPGGRA
jgi:hypothetical protein